MEGDITARMGNLVIQIGVLLFAVRFFGFLAKKARISSVLGELIAGVVIARPVSVLLRQDTGGLC